MFTTAKRVVVGRPLDSDAAGHATLPKRLALPIFCSDPLSSVAYATQEILLVLAIGGAAALTLTPWVGLAVVFLLVVVVASYSKTVYAYPGGGGAYAVSKENLGQTPALVAASALIVDYILTVSVSVTSGVSNLVSAFPGLAPHTLSICVGIVVLLTAVNLRGMRESGRAFAAPTYAFIAVVLTMLGLGLYKILFGDGVTAESAGYPVHGADLTGAALVFLVLRAFASGCTALTGVEAISNGVPFFRKPRSRNAAITLVVMGALAITHVLRGDPAGHLGGREVRRGPDRARAAGGLRAADGHRPAGHGGVRRRLVRVLLPADRHHAGAGPGGQHRVQRVPADGLGAGSRRLPAPSARTAG